MLFLSFVGGGILYVGGVVAISQTHDHHWWDFPLGVILIVVMWKLAPPWGRRPR